MHDNCKVSINSKVPISSALLDHQYVQSMPRKMYQKRKTKTNNSHHTLTGTSRHTLASVSPNIALSDHDYSKLLSNKLSSQSTSAFIQAPIPTPTALDHQYSKTLPGTSEYASTCMNNDVHASDTCLVSSRSETNFTPPVFSDHNCEDLTDQHDIKIISGENFNVLNVPGDGNCFFHCISLAIHGHIHQTQFYRNIICKFIYNDWHRWKDYAIICHDLEPPTAASYWQSMVSGNAWATSCEIQAASRCLERTFVTWLEGSRYDHVSNSYQTCYTNETYLVDKPADPITLLLVDNHFKLLHRVNPILAEIPQESQQSCTNGMDVQHHQSNNVMETRTCLTKTIPVGLVKSRQADNYHSFPPIKKCRITNSNCSMNTTKTQSGSKQSTHNSKSNQISTPHKHKVDIEVSKILESDNPANPNSNSVLPNNVASHEQRIPDTITKEMNTVTQQCRTLGIKYDMPKQEETTHEKELRHRRLVRAIKKKISTLEVHLDVPNLPCPHPISPDHRLNNAMDSIRCFELEQMTYSFNVCAICQECRLNMKMAPKSTTVCYRCSRDKEHIKMFSSKNIMDPGEVPLQLQGLTIVEQQLISKISPTINVHMLKHGGIAANGHCVAFPQAINEPSQIFPKLPEEINIIRVRKQGKNDTSKEFNVHRYSVQNALIWLKINNPTYADIIISQERLNLLPIDGSLDIHTVEYHPHTRHINDEGPAVQQLDGALSEDCETTSGVLLPEPTIDIHKEVTNTVKDVIGEGHGEVTINKKGIVTIPWPTRDSSPVSESTSQHFFTMAFPCLFPTGTGDFHINRPRTCSSMSDWAEHLLWYKDGRFAKHKFFKFIVHNIIMRKRVLEQSSYIVKQQLGDSHMTLGDLKEKLQKGDNSVGEKILYFGATLRGTSQYWTQKAKELRSLIQYKINSGDGLPSFFTTGSCAEYYFKPLKRLLQLYIHKVSGVDVDLSNRNNMFKALQDNTHVVAHYFDVRTQSYFKQVMGPVFGVDSYWYRQEFAKSRGMIHWHGLCWRSDREPHNLMYEAVQKHLSDTDCAHELATWAKSVFGLTACHPAGEDDAGQPRKDLWPPPEGTAQAPPEESNRLVNLLMDVCQSQASVLEDHILLTNRINLHRCSDYCLRLPNKHSHSIHKNVERTCRMGFGTTSVPGREIRLEHALVNDKNGSCRLEMKRDHPMLVQHSQYHTQAWRANGDISIIVSKSNPANPTVNEIIATEKYVCGYACKGNEPTGVTVDLFNDMVNSADNTTGVTAKALCTKLLMGTVKRDISSVEASFELSALPLYRCSHQFQSVSMSGSRVLERTGSTVTRETALDKYLARNNDDHSSWYNFICRQGRVPVISGGNIRATSPLAEEYCRTMLLLHCPNWRCISDIKHADCSWSIKMHEFLKSTDCPNFVKADVERARRHTDSNIKESDKDSSSQIQVDAEIEHPDWMDVIQPNAVYDDFSTDFQYDDGGPDYNWSATSLEYHVEASIKWLEKLQEEQKKAAVNVTLQLPDVSLESLNTDQRFAFNLVLKTLKDYRQNLHSYQPLRLVVGGTAGSGKSHLINCLVKSIRILFGTNKAAQVLCPTGNSANIISGVTLHSFLKIPTNSKASQEMSPPDGSRGEALQKNCEGVVALLVDERSLIGCTTLGWMEFMCKCGMNNGSNSLQLWGGIPVVVFLGDDIQLPPVCDSPVYNCKSCTPAAIHGALVWKTFDCAIILQSIIRQEKNQQQFKDALLSLRDYKLTTKQCQWLQNFQWNKLLVSHGQELLNRMTENGLFVFPTHSEEWEHNKKQILEVNNYTPIAKIDAVTTGIHSTSATSDKACGLIRTLYLCRGARVMLTTNILVEYGLFNGSIGTVIDIIYLNGKHSKESLPDVVLVEFSKYSGPPFIEHRPQCVPIAPVKRKIDCNCQGCFRTQIPLRLGWGTTIHRCQGMTIGKNESNRYIVINPGNKSFESRNPGALFVALSRAKTAGNYGVDPDFAWNPQVLVNEDRLCHVVKTPTTRARAAEIDRIKQLAEQTRQQFADINSDIAFFDNLKLLGQEERFPILEE